MEEAGITGPLFISIGDKEKLEKFLELNPSIDRSKMFVDDYSFDAYSQAGFGKLDFMNMSEAQKEEVKSVKLEAPELGFKGWWNYMSNVMSLSPIEPGKKPDGIPEGVLRLGGTFVVSGDTVVYQWSDKVPGDHPNLDTVFQAAKTAAENEEEQYSTPLWAKFFR